MEEQEEQKRNDKVFQRPGQAYSYTKIDVTYSHLYHSAHRETLSDTTPQHRTWPQISDTDTIISVGSGNTRNI